MQGEVEQLPQSSAESLSLERVLRYSAFWVDQRNGVQMGSHFQKIWTAENRAYG